MTQIRILAVCLMCLSIYATGQTLPPASTPEQLAIDGRGQGPVLSPDGRFLAFAQEHFTHVRVIDLKTNVTSDVCHHAGAGWGMTWLDDRYLILRSIAVDEETGKRSMGVEVIDMVTATESTLIPFNNANRIEVPRWIREGTVTIMNLGEEHVIETGQTSPEIRKAGESENLYSVRGSAFVSGPLIVPTPAGRGILSAAWLPDGTKALVELHGQPSLFLFQKANSSFELLEEKGERPSWVNNELYVFMQVDDDGHDITAGDIYLRSIKNSSRQNLTSELQAIAMNPTAASDGSVVFNTTEGKLFRIKIALTR